VTNDKGAELVTKAKTGKTWRGDLVTTATARNTKIGGFPCPVNRKKDFKFAKNQDCSTLEFAHAAIYHHLLAFKCHYPLDYYDYYGSKDLFS